AVRELLSHGLQGGLQLAGRMGEVLEDHTAWHLGQQLQTFGRSVETRDGLVEHTIADAQLVAHVSCTFEILKVVLTENAQCHITMGCDQAGDTIIYAVRWHAVRYGRYAFGHVGCYGSNFRVFRTVDQLATSFN